MRKDFEEIKSVQEVDFDKHLRLELDYIYEMLVVKNKSYGNSALDPIRIFSKAAAKEQLLVRIDDKLSRLKRGNEYADEDTVLDLIGYLLLLRIEVHYA